MNVLLAGGAGYIGSHTCVELLNAGHDVIVADNFSNSCPEAIKRVEEITGKKVPLYEADVCEKEAVDKIFAENKIDAVIHFAGLKAVDIIMGIIVLGMAALAIYVRQCLAHYKAGAPMKYVIILTINAVVSLLYIIIASIIIGKSALTVSVITNIVGTIVVAALSYTYFQKRKFMFTR